MRSAAFGRSQIMLVLLLETGGEHEQEGLSAADAQESSQENETSDVNCVMIAAPSLVAWRANELK